jgi:hypothetical protein
MTTGEDEDWMKGREHLTAGLSPRELRVLRKLIGSELSVDEQLAVIKSRLMEMEEKAIARLEKRPPPSHTRPRVSTDENGVWVSVGAGTYYGVSWEEVGAVSASRVDLGANTEIILALEVVYGESVEINASFEGFSDLVGELSQRLGLESAWFEAVKERLVLSNVDLRSEGEGDASTFQVELEAF